MPKLPNKSRDGILALLKRFSGIIFGITLVLAALGFPLGCETTPMEDGIHSHVATGGMEDLRGDAGSGGLDGGVLDLVWTEEQKLFDPSGEYEDLFGLAVSLSGDTAVIGVPGDSDAGYSAGSVFVYVREKNKWTLEQKLVADGAAKADLFGFSVSIEGDTIAVGAVADDTLGKAAGAVYVFERSKGTWSETQKLTASDGEPTDNFGYSVALGGDTVLVGSISSDSAPASGSAYVFVNNGKLWTEQQKLIPLDGEKEDLFGVHVSISGDTALIGAFLDDEIGIDSGSAYIFVRDTGIWTLQQKLLPSVADANDLFGFSTAIDGDTVVIGAHLGDQKNPDTGAAFVFVRIGDTWTEEQTLVTSDIMSGDAFGAGVSIHGDTILISAPIDGENGEAAGSAFVFEREGAVWQEKQKLFPSDGEAGAVFGRSISLFGDSAIVGALLDDGAVNDSGSAYVFRKTEPLGLSAGCSQDIQCESGFCVDGVCCESACGDNNPLDCLACSIEYGSSQDGVCESLDGTICDDGDDLTVDDFCDMGTCRGTIPEMDTNTDEDTDTDTDTDTDDESDNEDSQSCGCHTVGNSTPIKPLSPFAALGLRLIQEGRP